MQENETTTGMPADEIVPDPAGSDAEKMSAESRANLEKYGVRNPKGRIASLLSLIVWSIFLAMLFIMGDWSMGPVLLMVAFVLLLLLSLVRVFQEWKENGDWLD